MRPPRFLWVPFPLGRPLGAPGNGAFQHRVIGAALQLLEADQRPVLEDFPDDVPAGGSGTVQDFTPPLLPADLEAATVDQLPALVSQEIEQLIPRYELARETRGRTTFGLSGLDPLATAQFLARFLDDDFPEPFRADLSLGEALKLASEDLKAYYLEAATAESYSGPHEAIHIWFWQHTAAGRLLNALQSRCSEADDPAVKSVAQTSFLPRAYQL